MSTPSIHPSVRPVADPAPVPTLRISRWNDPLIDRLGHDPRSCYVERFWLGILGPSTTWLLRLFADTLDAHPDGAELHLTEVAARLGIGHKGGRNSPLARSIQRACRFGAARVAGSAGIEVRYRLAPLNRAQVERLPADLQAEHTRLLTTPTDDPSVQRRARRLALSLIECGDALDETERQLDGWRVPPPVAAEAVRWAWERHRGAEALHPDAA